MKVKRENKRIMLWAGVLFWIVSWILMSTNWSEAQYIGTYRWWPGPQIKDSLDAKLDTSAVKAGDNVTVDWDGSGLTIASTGGASGVGDSANVLRGEMPDTAAEVVEDSLVEIRSEIAALPTFAEAGGLAGDSLTDFHSFKDEVLKYMSFDEDSVVVDSNLYVYGKIWIQDSLIVNATIIKIPPVDSSAWGKIILRQAGENLVFGESTYLKSDGKYWKTDSDAAATMPSRLVALATISAEGWGLFLKEGMIRADDWDLTIGGYVYPSLTPGDFTQTQVSATGDQSQKVGIAETADVIDYDPDLTVLEMK